MNKFIFLDIDGVMNSNLFYLEKVHSKRYDEWIKEHPQQIAWSACNIDPKAVERLNRIIDATGAKIVVSSSWRSDSNLQKVFNLVGIKEPIYGTTSFMRDRHRGDEIQEWLDKQTEPYRYVILDDDADMLDCQLPYFIQTNWMKWGLSDEDVELAIRILNDPNSTADSDRPLDIEILAKNLIYLKVNGVISNKEYEYLKYLIIKENA